MTRMRNRYLLTVVLLCLAVVLTSCSQKPAEQPAKPADKPAEQPAEKKILLGVAGPLTGDSAVYGTGLKRAVAFAIEEINAAGGVNGAKFDAIYEDDKGDPKEAANVAQKLASNPDVFAVIGHVNSSCTLAAMPIYQRAGLTCLSSSSSNPALTKMGYTNFLRTITNDYLQGEPMAKLAVETLKAKKVAIIYANSDYGRGLLDATLPVLKKYGGEVVAQETFVPGVDKDFSAQLTKIKKAGGDALLIISDYTEAGLIVRQMAAAGLGKMIKIGSAAIQSQQFIDLAGKEAAEGTYILSYWNPDSKKPGVQEYVKRFQAKYGAAPDEREAYGYEAPFILKLAIEKGATKANLAQVLHTVEYQGHTGYTKFDASGDVQEKDQFVLVVKDGKIVSWEGEK
ncbi:MAG: ABC transporter substrate-binding protein [Ignavibacteriales bacterium]